MPGTIAFSTPLPIPALQQFGGYGVRRSSCANAVGKAAQPSKSWRGYGYIILSIFTHRLAEEEEMSGHAGSITAGVLASAVYLAGSLSFSAMAGDEPPNFAPNSNIGWYAY